MNSGSIFKLSDCYEVSLNNAKVLPGLGGKMVSLARLAGNTSSCCSRNKSAALIVPPPREPDSKATTPAGSTNPSLPSAPAISSGVGDVLLADHGTQHGHRGKRVLKG